MKILFHHRTSSKDGQAVHIEELVGALRSIGHDVVVVGPATHAQTSFGAAGGWTSTLKRLLPKFAYELLEFAYSVPAFLRMVRAIRQHHPDAIYERYNLFFLAGVWSARLFGLPLLLEVNGPLYEERCEHGGLALQRLARWSQRYVWRRASYVLPVTRVLASFAERAGVPSERITVVPNGINLDHFSSAPTTLNAKETLALRDKLIIGFTGFMRPWHGIDRAIEWLASVRDRFPQAHLLLVGDGPARPALEALTRQLGLASRVTFTGVVDRDRIPAYVAAFDIALQPAVVAYASPLKLFEYLALGKPVVAPRTPNLCEVLDHGRNALLFEPDDRESFFASLSELARNAELRASLGASARATIDTKQLTWAHNARRVSALIVAALHAQSSEVTA